MIEVGQRELAQAEKPVRMAGPLHVQIVAKIERQCDAAAHQFIHDGAIVDALDRNLRPSRS